MRTAGVRDHSGESEVLEPDIALRRMIVRRKQKEVPARYLVGALQPAIAVEALCSGFGPASRKR